MRPQPSVQQKAVEDGQQVQVQLRSEGAGSHWPSRTGWLRPAAMDLNRHIVRLHCIPWRCISFVSGCGRPSVLVTSDWVAVHRYRHAGCEIGGDLHSPQVKGIRKALCPGAELYREAIIDQG